MNPLAAMALFEGGRNLLGSIAGARASRAQNAEIRATNTANTIRAGYRNGLLKVQQGFLKKQAAQAGTDLTSQAKQALGSVQANAAASGTIGASVDAAQKDIEARLDEAKIGVRADLEQGISNIDQQIHENSLDAIEALIKPVKVQSFQSMLFGSALAGVTAAGAQYAQAKFQLGQKPMGG